MKFNTLSKSIQILDLFLSPKTSLSEKDISAFMNMPRSTTYKYLSALRALKLLNYDSRSGQYMLGTKFSEFSRVPYLHSKVSKISIPFMKILYNEVQETVTLDVLMNNKGYLLEMVAKEDGIGYIAKRGSEIPLHCGASGQLLLAFSEDKDMELFLKTVELRKYTERTITDKKSLKERLRQIREAGYAYSDGEFQGGGRAMAAPVFDGDGKICAALCVAGSFQSMNVSSIEKIRRTVIKYANEITDHLRFENKDE